MSKPLWWIAALVAPALAGCGDADVRVYESMADEEAVAEAELGFAGDPANGAVYALDVSFWEGPIAQHSMDCFWDSNVRHLVAGTQVEEITRQQLAMAVARGMTVDAYVYLYWGEDMATQVQRAFGRVTGFPLGRMWLDIEEKPGSQGATALTAMARAAVEACRAQAPAGVGCGIYTGPGFWKTYMNDTSALADVPLWYAWYNDATSLSAWSVEKFGGWAAPAGKQWAERVLCGIGVDRNTMQVLTAPQVVVDRTAPPQPSTVPPAPTGVWPRGRTGLDYFRLMADSIPWTVRWTFALESWTGTQWAPYASWSQSVPSRTVYPYWLNRLYRVRARAQNAKGWGDWSGWVQIEQGTWPGARPPAEPGQPAPTQPAPTQPAPTQPAPTQPPPSPPPAAPGAPTGLSPDGLVLSPGAVTLSCNPVAGASSYEFAVEYLVNGAWRAYYTYLPSGPKQVFYPQVKASYRFTARARANGSLTPGSSATFEVR